MDPYRDNEEEPKHTPMPLRKESLKGTKRTPDPNRPPHRTKQVKGVLILARTRGQDFCDMLNVDWMEPLIVFSGFEGDYVWRGSGGTFDVYDNKGGALSLVVRQVREDAHITMVSVPGALVLNLFAEFIQSVYSEALPVAFLSDEQAQAQTNKIAKGKPYKSQKELDNIERFKRIQARIASGAKAVEAYEDEGISRSTYYEWRNKYK